MSANTIRHKSNSNYDIDGFIKQLLASRKFDELAEKVAEKAVSKIKDIEATPNKSSNTQPHYQEQSKMDYEKESNLFNSNINLRNDNPSGRKGKIDTHAVMDEANSEAESLKLKFKFLTRNAYEKKVFNDRASDDNDRSSSPRNNKNEESSIQNVKIGPAETEGRIINQEVTGKIQHGSKIEEGNRHDTRDDERKDSDSNRQSIRHSSGRDIDRNENIKKTDYFREDVEPQHEQKRPREAQNSRPEFKSAVKGPVEMKTETRTEQIEEETLLSVDEGQLEERTQENNEEDFKEIDSEENGDEGEAAPFRFRAEAESYPDVNENKVTSVGHIQEHILSDGYENSDNSSKKPIIRREGNKLFTFVESEEYAEYHEERAKLNKDKDKSPDQLLLI